ncbi:TsoY family (seleno)protein [Celeribacter sp.]|uniref:TsoY family (seleno)protein n=1 Tax=Celeribacter sp. TaxID=1890673 RepID=UPI003A8DC806
MKSSKASESYVPMYFLTSVGAGGLAVTFFMYLMFWIPHPGRSVPVFEDIMAAWATGGTSLKVAIAIAMAGIAVFVYLNLKSLIWNLSHFAQFKKTERYTKLRNSNAETTLLAMPLALAMSVNGLFITGLVFVPGLWTVVEYLFPLALIAFAAIAYTALRTIADFLGRVLSKGGVFDVTAHNSFAQLLPSFALIMSAVGFAAPAAMSTQPWIVAISVVGSTVLGTAALIYALLALTTAFNSMLHYGTAEEAGPTLLIIIPFVTIFSIMFMRQDHGLHATFNGHSTAVDTLMFLAKGLSVQLVFLGLGLTVLRRQGYFQDFVFGDKTSPGSYALVCPGVALSVLLQFFVNKGLVAADVIEKFGTTYWVITAIAIAFQFAMIALVFRLNAQHYGTRTPSAIPAE